MSNTEGTPSARWRVAEAAYGLGPILQDPEGVFVGLDIPADRDRILATQNETEALREKLAEIAVDLYVAHTETVMVQDEREALRAERDSYADAVGEMAWTNAALRERLRLAEALIARVATMRKHEWIALSLEARYLAGAGAAPQMDTTDGAYDRIYGPGSRKRAPREAETFEEYYGVPAPDAIPRGAAPQGEAGRG